MMIAEGYRVVSAEGIWVDRNLDEDWLIVDVRATEAFARGHVPDAVHIPQEELDQHELRLRVFARGRSVAFVCEPGDELRAQRSLADVGLPDAFALQGGVAGWQSAGFAVERSGLSLASDGTIGFVTGGLVVGGFLMGALVSSAFFVLPSLIGAGLAIAGVRRDPSLDTHSSSAPSLALIC